MTMISEQLIFFKIYFMKYFLEDIKRYNLIKHSFDGKTVIKLVNVEKEK